MSDRNPMWACLTAKVGMFNLNVGMFNFKVGMFNQNKKGNKEKRKSLSGLPE